MAQIMVTYPLKRMFLLAVLMHFSHPTPTLKEVLAMAVKIIIVQLSRVKGSFNLVKENVSIIAWCEWEKKHKYKRV